MVSIRTVARMADVGCVFMIHRRNLNLIALITPNLHDVEAAAHVPFF